MRKFQNIIAFICKPQKFPIIIFVFFVFLLILGFIIRTNGIFVNNVLFLYDNGRDLLYVKKIVIDHDLLLIGPSSGLEGYFHGVFWYYLLSIPFIIGDGHPVFFTWFMVISSMLSVVLTFFILKKISGIYAALMGAAIFSLASFSVATSRFIWNPYPIVWLMPLYFLALFYFSKRKRYALPFLAFITGLIIHFEVIYGICLLPPLILMIIIEIKRKEVLKQKILKLFIVSLLFSLPFFPTIVFDLRHNFLITSNIKKTILMRGSNIAHRRDEKPNPIPERIRLRFDDLYSYTVHSITPNSTINIFLFLIFIAGLISIIKQKNSELKLFYSLLFIILISPFFIFLALKYSVWGYYWIGSPPAYALALAFVIGYLVNKNRYLLLLFFVLLIFMVLSYKPLSKIENWYKGDLKQGSQTLPTQMEVVKKIYKDANKDDFSVYVMTPPVYDYVYRYLFWWQGRQEFHYPKDKKQRIVYLIIEPNPSDPKAEYFKKNVVQTANKSINTFMFPDVIIEKILTASSEAGFDKNYLPPL